MEVYKKNTKISITIRGDGSELLEYNLPHPRYYHRIGDIYTVEYIIDGFFNTSKGVAYLNDILARFMLSMKVLETEVQNTTEENGIRLKSFQNLNSVAKFKYRETVDIGRDNIFWAIKLFAEDSIRQYGEGNEVPYCLIESFAFDRFVKRAKDESTLRAKCRSVWEWYNNRGWTIPLRKGGTGMSRTENAKRQAQKKAEAAKRKVQKAIAGLEFMKEKVNIANVSRDAKVSRDTAKKYLIELGYIEAKAS